MSNTEPLTIDYDSSEIPESARIYKPKLFKEGVKYCALLGEDPQAGIFGCGDTPLDALLDWDKAYQYLRTKDPELKSVFCKTTGPSNLWLDFKQKAS